MPMRREGTRLHRAMLFSQLHELIATLTTLSDTLGAIAVELEHVCYKKRRRAKVKAKASEGSVRSSYKDTSHLFDNSESKDASITGPDTSEYMKTSVDDLFETGPVDLLSELSSQMDDDLNRKKQFKLKPPPGPSNFKKKKGTGQRIPQIYFTVMFRMCYMIDATQPGQVKMLGQREAGKVAQTVKIMYEAGANLDRLNEFQLWWVNQSLSKDRDSGDYRTPTPSEVRKYWGRAMADRDKQKIGGLAAVQGHEDRMSERKIQDIQRAYMENR